MTVPFKKCTGCKQTWNTQMDFLSGLQNGLRVKGFQADFGTGENSMILFNHDVDNCGTTIAIPVLEFANLLPGYFLREKPGNLQTCAGSCLTNNDLTPCSAVNCRNGLVANFISRLSLEQK